jgi:hypothetical protein
MAGNVTEWLRNRPEPKELALLDDVGHLPPAELRLPAIRDFLHPHLR